MSDAYLLFPQDRKTFEISILLPSFISTDPKNLELIKVPIYLTRDEKGLGFRIGDTVNARMNLV